MLAGGVQYLEFCNFLFLASRLPYSDKIGGDSELGNNRIVTLLTHHLLSPRKYTEVKTIEGPCSSVHSCAV